MPETLMEAPEALRPYGQVLRAGTQELYGFVAGVRGAPGVLLIHGLGDEGDTWRHLIPTLARRYRVVAPDLPGYGRSPALAGALSTAALARLMTMLIQSLRLGPAVVVGHSAGAQVAQRLALAAPDLVERLVLLGGHLPVERRLPPPGPLWAFLTPGVGELAYTSLRRSQDEAYATLRPYYADLNSLPEEEQAFLRRRVWARVWSDRQRAAFLSQLRWLAVDSAARAPSYRAAIARSTTPTTVLWGERDALAPPASGEAVAALIPAPGVRFHVFAGCGHNVQHERPAELAALLA